MGKQIGARAAGGLTQKQEAFCLAFIETGNASEAYRRAYQPKRMTEKSVHERASQVVAGIKVQSRLAELRAKAADKAVLTLAKHLQRLNDLSELAEQNGQFDAAIRAEKHRGEAAGLYPDRSKPVNVNVGLSPSTEPVSETSKWLSGVKGNGRAHPA
jgi:hypothetical protein